MIVVTGKIRIDPAHRDAAVEAVRPLIEATRAEEGNLEYAFSFDVLEEGLVRIVEHWESQSAIDAHMATPHLAEFMAAAGGFGVTEIDIVQFETEGPTKVM